MCSLKTQHGPKGYVGERIRANEEHILGCDQKLKKISLVLTLISELRGKKEHMRFSTTTKTGKINSHIIFISRKIIIDKKKQEICFNSEIKVFVSSHPKNSHMALIPLP